MKALPPFLPATLAAIATATVLTASPQTPAAPASAGATAAHVRLWKIDLHGLTGLRVSFKPAGGRRAVARELGGGEPDYQFDNYADVPSGPGTFEAFAGKDKHPFSSLPGTLSPGSFLTLILSASESADGSPALTLVDDGSATTDSVPAQLTVRNFMADLKGARVVVGDSLNAQFAPGAGFLAMRGIKPAVYQIRTSGTGPDSKPFQWNNEVNLRQYRRQTLLIYPDPYGRVRPRLVVDGKMLEPLPAAKNETR